jgi:hypothetical protein
MSKITCNNSWQLIYEIQANQTVTFGSVNDLSTAIQQGADVKIGTHVYRFGGDTFSSFGCTQVGVFNGTNNDTVVGCLYVDNVISLYNDTIGMWTLDDGPTAHHFVWANSNGFFNEASFNFTGERINSNANIPYHTLWFVKDCDSNIVGDVAPEDVN